MTLDQRTDAAIAQGKATQELIAQRKAAGWRASYRNRGNTWEGVIRQGRKIIHTCGHSHHNRDQDSRHWGPAAISCANAMMRDADLSSTP
jgi:hypothetical protein